MLMEVDTKQLSDKDKKIIQTADEIKLLVREIHNKIVKSSPEFRFDIENNQVNIINSQDILQHIGKITNLTVEIAKKIQAIDKQ